MYISEIEGEAGITAKVVADSIANGTRITTLELKYPRFIHAEFMTHRMFSRNASSSRAIPTETLLAQVEEYPARPVYWGLNKSGMQAKEETIRVAECYQTWKESANYAARFARHLAKVEMLHKQIVNRLIEPFQFITVVVTATEWENFFSLRLHIDAQPEIRELARCMKKAMFLSMPKPLAHNEWHVPYITSSDPLHSIRECSVARCARVSYLNHDNTKPDTAKDIDLHNKLLSAGHMSPFEHIAKPMPKLKDLEHLGVTHMDNKNVYWSGNFRNWVQYRQLL